MLGTIVVGTVATIRVNVHTSFIKLNAQGGTIVNLQHTLDGILPKLLTAVSCYTMSSSNITSYIPNGFDVGRPLMATWPEAR